MNEEKIALLMKKLDISREDAIEIIKSDDEIDHGADPFPLTKEQAKASKKARSVGRAPTVYKFEKKERPPDEQKRHLIGVLAKAVGVEVNILNPQREFEFVFEGKKYKVTLSAPRK